MEKNTSSNRARRSGNKKTTSGETRELTEEDKRKCIALCKCILSCCCMCCAEEEQPENNTVIIYQNAPPQQGQVMVAGNQQYVSGQPINNQGVPYNTNVIYSQGNPQGQVYVQNQVYK